MESLASFIAVFLSNLYISFADLGISNFSKEERKCIDGLVQWIDFYCFVYFSAFCHLLRSEASLKQSFRNLRSILTFFNRCSVQTFPLIIWELPESIVQLQWALKIIFAFSLWNWAILHRVLLFSKVFKGSWNQSTLFCDSKRCTWSPNVIGALLKGLLLFFLCSCSRYSSPNIQDHAIYRKSTVLPRVYHHFQSIFELRLSFCEYFLHN